MRPVRTRFAPSPTGDLHVGNLRVAIFNQLFARRHGGQFVVRVEDTDLERNQEGSLEGILEDLSWAGLDWDEGPDRPGPFGSCRQREREPLHQAAALGLLEAGKAYACFCAEASEGESTSGRDGAPEAGCPGGCAALSPADVARRREAGERPVIRFPVPPGPILFEDQIRGTVHFEGSDIGDFVILRSDGRPTYNFAVVVDDIGMAITHVIRGAGHLSNTPRQAILFDALGAPRPIFAHLPTVLGSDRRKLSKREGAAGVRRLREAGFDPDGVVNYLSLLGWSTGDDREVLSRDELIGLMDLDRVGAADTVFDPEKLRWMSGQHLARRSIEALSEAVQPHVDAERFPRFAQGGVPLRLAVEAIRTRIQVLSDVNAALELLEPTAAVLEAGYRAIHTDEGPFAKEVLAAVADALALRTAEDDWQAAALGKAVRDAGAALGVRGPSLFHPVRLALSGDRAGPDLGLVLQAIGRDRAVGRLRDALNATMV
jgi:nondiscriminating glutamyl-tRNA synthetase